MITSPIGRIWKYENRISSDGETIEVSIKNLIPDNAGNFRDLFGKLVKVDGKIRLNGIFSCGPFQEERKVTTDCFDQVELYSSLNDVQEYLSELGVDTQQILASKHRGNPHPIVAHANATTDLNAWYSPQGDDLTFGTAGDMAKGEDKWHLASDSDVGVHEGGHMILDHLNPKLGGWWSGEGRAIHEGFGDLLAALRYDDPEMSEDFVPNIGRPESKTDGLRIVDNVLTLGDVGDEEHDRGQVYSGFLWSVKKRLPLDSRKAADVALQLLFAHAYQYKTSKPKPSDFVDAVIRGAESLAAAGKLSVDLDLLKTIIREEAIKRGFIKETSEPEIEFSSMSEVENRFGQGGLTRFVLSQRNMHLGVEQRIYQQQYKTNRYGYVDVVGQGVIEHRQQGISTVTIKDVRQIRPGDIDETIKTGTLSAYKIAKARADTILIDIQRKKAALELMMKFQPVSTREFLSRLAAVQMEYQIARAAVKTLEQMKGTGFKARLVILPNSNHLHYEFKVGLGIYYIDAKTGEARFERDVFVN